MQKQYEAICVQYVYDTPGLSILFQNCHESLEHSTLLLLKSRQSAANVYFANKEGW